MARREVIAGIGYSLETARRRSGARHVSVIASSLSTQREPALTFVSDEPRFDSRTRV